MSTRLNALTGRLEAPLLVTNLTNILYLTDFDASNAALFVEPGGSATLYTDFRYIESARRVAGVEVQMTKRSLMRDVGERLKGRVQFEADVLPYAEWERLSAGAGKLVPTVGIVDSQRAVKDVDEVGKLRRAAKIADRGLEALTAADLGRPQREGAGVAPAGAAARPRRGRALVRLDRRFRAERRLPATPIRPTGSSRRERS